MNDQDLSKEVTKEKLDEIMAPLLARFQIPIKRALSDTGLTRYVKPVFVIHVGGTRCVTASTDNIMNRHARITLTVAFIRTCIFICLFDVEYKTSMIKTNAFFQMFGFTSDDFYAVEIVGGSMRIPAFKIAAAQAVGVFKGNFFFWKQWLLFLLECLDTMITFFCWKFLDTTIHLFVETLISFFFFG